MVGDKQKGREVGIGRDRFGCEREMRDANRIVGR